MRRQKLLLVLVELEVSIVDVWNGIAIFRLSTCCTMVVTTSRLQSLIEPIDRDSHL